VNFFEAQDRSRRMSRWLVVVFLLATAAIIAAVTLIVAAALALMQPEGAVRALNGGWPGGNTRLLGTVALATAGVIGLELGSASSMTYPGAAVGIGIWGEQRSSEDRERIGSSRAFDITNHAGRGAGSALLSRTPRDHLRGIRDRRAHGSARGERSLFSIFAVGP